LTRAGQPELAAEVAAFGERYPARRRCPADDRATDRASDLATDMATDRATAPEESA
jgi:hypothetical protein